MASEQNVRGVSRQESYASDSLRSVAGAAFYVPRQVLNAGMKGLEETGTFLSDSDTIRFIKETLYLYERKLAWFPVASFGSDLRPSSGAGLYFNQRFLVLFCFRSTYFRLFEFEVVTL